MCSSLMVGLCANATVRVTTIEPMRKLLAGRSRFDQTIRGDYRPTLEGELPH